MKFRKEECTKTLYSLLCLISLISVSLPIFIDYFVYPKSPLSIYLLFLIPVVIFSLFYNTKGILIGTLCVNAIHITWGTIILPKLVEVDIVNRIYNHLGLAFFSIGLASLLAIYRTEMKKKENAIKKREIMLSEAQRISHIGSWEANLVKQNLYWSKETYEIFGCKPSSYTPSYESFLNFIPEEERDFVHQQNVNAWSGKPYEIEHRIIRADGAERIVKQNAEVLFNTNGEAQHMIGTIQDITEKREVERKLKANEERFRALVQNSYDITSIVDHNGILKYQSPSSERVLGYRSEELLHNNGFNFNHPEDIEKARKIFEKSLNSPGKPIKEEIRIRHKNGSWLHCDVAFTNLINHPSVKGIVVNIRDITEYKKALFQIEHMALHDVTTKLLNKRGLYHYIEQTIKDAIGHNNKFSIFYLDLDGFKIVNDTLGHGIGDKLLIMIANNLKELIHERGYVARIGGDEFVIVVKNSSEDTAIELSNSILQMFNKPLSIDQYNFQITSSIGVVNYPIGGLDPETLLKNADAAMYRAKSLGKNNYQFFDYEMIKNNKQNFQLQNDLRKAIKENELVLYYQPRINAENNKTIGIEALLRWFHPTLGYIPPLEFISIAESCGIIIQIGDWVLEEACRQLVEWDEAGYNDLTMAVNISTVQFMQKDFSKKVELILRKHKVNPNRLEIEVTETAFIEQETAIQENIINLKALGVRIAIDDFGTGYSSLLYIRKFEADTIKIDKSFVSNLNEDNKNQGIVSTIVNLAKVLNLNVVAEGVETSEQYCKLKEMKCTEVQGYFFSKPLPSSELKKFLKNEQHLDI